MRIWTADGKSNIFIDYCNVTKYWVHESHIQDYDIVLIYEKKRNGNELVFMLIHDIIRKSCTVLPMKIPYFM